MVCSVCAELCRCPLSSSGAPTPLHARFEVDQQASLRSVSQAHVEIDQRLPKSEATPLSTRLETPLGASPRARFIPDPAELAGDRPTIKAEETEESSRSQQRTTETEEPAGLVMLEQGDESAETASGASSSPDDTPSAEQNLEPSLSSPDMSAWKQEVAARVSRYRRRRPRPPKYPSLRLKFPAEQSWTAQAQAPALETIPDDGAGCDQRQTTAAVARQRSAAIPPRAPSPTDPRLRESGRILEFPRSVLAPQNSIYELAEPVTDWPRIVEAPEIAPLPPALGGIMIESEDDEVEKRPGLEIPLQLAPLRRRVFALTIDGVMVLASCALFAYVFFKMTGLTPPPTQLVGLSIALPALFWIGYQYLCVVWTGSTPGLRLARMRVSYFDGSPVGRSMRRWRVLASVVSLISLGLGFAWSFLDEDALCWHDRITHTYLAPGDSP